MSTNLDKLIGRFIGQRLEMGETEWYFAPLRFSNATLQKAAPIRQHSHTDTGDTSRLKRQPADSTAGEPAGACTVPDITNEAIIRQTSLEELNTTVCGCLRCPLGKTRINFVFGDGSPTADIMFVGEAPGAEEDRQGIPFVGRAGQLLTDMITATKLKREEVYIGNILKCRPPQNRDPKPDEIEQCEPILIRQIEIIKPRIICTLGRIAAQTLLRTTATLGALRGKTHDYHGVRLIATYHPAALLRNPNFKRPAWEDLKFMRREYDGLEL